MPDDADEHASLAARLGQINHELRTLEQQSGRASGSVTLVAVSKRHPAERIREAYACGQRAFGENYLQEARAKQNVLADLAIEWHFIGAIQSNKTAEIAQHFDWVHTVDRPRIARRLNDQRPADREPLNVLLQVNISGEASKSGVTPEALPELVATVATLPRLRMRGLMALPAPSADVASQRTACRSLAQLAHTLGTAGASLSMGTSDDYAAAIAEGATHVRLGTAIFGPRPDAA